MTGRLLMKMAKELAARGKVILLHLSTQDTHTCLVLLPAVEVFFIVHASSAEAAVPSKGSEQGSSQGSSQATSNQGSSQATSSQGGAGPSSELAAPPPLLPLPTDGLESEQSSQPKTTQSKFLKFAETHRTVLNEILRQRSTPLVDGPFSVLVNLTRMLDFDVKRRYFRSELECVDEAVCCEELALHVKRASIFEDPYHELHHCTPEEWKNRFHIVFEGEEGQDVRGLLREWYMIILREIFNPDYALFTTSESNKVMYTINTSSHYNPDHLLYFKFIGRVIAKAIYDNKLLECYFTRSFYKHILGIPVKYTDMESEDYTFYKSLAYLKRNHISSIGYDLTLSVEVQEVGVTEVRELKPDGQNIPVTEENKLEYIHLVCQMEMTGAIRKQLYAFLEGFYNIIHNRLISIFNKQELELLISGLPYVGIDDLKANTEYYNYQPSSLQIQWFWRALREFNQAERAKFLQFVTGTSKVPLQGFSALEGMNGVQKFQIHRDERSTDRLPSAHTCFNQLDLPVYEDSQKLRNNLLKAIYECSEGFGFA
ncbi:E3 ubiquitin-protein ligase HUWE1-like [Nilaparvata lugens]|uniref:E3 ubiquitin-protein ligase HUWE1-like n=1 Tax=Nilaparvata lugens TaxID=108931 RepID=UPI00193CB664|nr:E3 ubiquitin-protein ligase HUWE1-like [Nilaparvata lugens]